MEILTLITPTGDRPLAFALCQNWIRKQTLQSAQWIVVDDGKIPLKPYIPMEYVRREPHPNDPQCTLSLNLEASLPLIKGNKIIIIEDDDYYAPKYVAEMALRLDQHEIVGIGDAKYYHLNSGRYYRHGNMNRASLAQTAFRASFIPEFKEILNRKRGSTFIDSIIWEKAGWNGRGFIFIDNNNDSLYAGIKGLPGRRGVIGHNPKSYRNPHVDISRKVLRQWVPKDHDVYMAFVTRKLTEENYQSWLKM